MIEGRLEVGKNERVKTVILWSFFSFQWFLSLYFDSNGLREPYSLFVFRALSHFALSTYFYLFIFNFYSTIMATVRGGQNNRSDPIRFEIN